MTEIKREFSTDQEAMEFFNCSRKTLIRLSNEAGAIYHFGRSTRFDIPKIAEFIKTHKTVDWNGSGINLKAESELEA